MFFRDAATGVWNELGLRGIPFRTKHEVAVFYKGQLATHYKPDQFVFEAIVVELKAVTELTSEHEAQLFNYMREEETEH